jgi:hypothetical protein
MCGRGWSAILTAMKRNYLVGLAFGALLFGACGAEFFVNFDDFPEHETRAPLIGPGQSFLPLSAFLDIDALRLCVGPDFFFVGEPRPDGLGRMHQEFADAPGNPVGADASSELRERVAECLVGIDEVSVFEMNPGIGANLIWPLEVVDSP